ncbi:unnamed protein product, partial [Schistosoma mattheei]
LFLLFRHETPSKNSSEICQPDNIPSSSSENSSMNMNSDDNTKECILNPVNMDDCSILQHEQCNDTQSNQSIFFDLLSKLERHLDEERKATLWKQFYVNRSFCDEQDK